MFSVTITHIRRLTLDQYVFENEVSVYACALGQAGQVNVVEVIWRPDSLHQPGVRHIQLEREQGRVGKITKYSHGAAGKTTIFSEAQLRIKDVAIEAEVEEKTIRWSCPACAWVQYELWLTC
jgi:hypothetical protein